VSQQLRVAVIGVGAMGADHVARLSTRIRGACVAVVCDAAPDRARQIAAGVPEARVIDDPDAAVAAADVDAVLVASPGPAHEAQLLACLDHGKPVLCEKPLTTDVAAAARVLRREAETGRRLIQVGFMRRYDREYVELKQLLDAGELGAPLVMHCVHRNPSAPPHFDSTTIVDDSLVHEVDATRYLLGEEIRAVTMFRPTPNPRARASLQDPQFAVFETDSGRIVDVEVFVTSGVGYYVRTEVVGELGSATIGLDVGPVRVGAAGSQFGVLSPDYLARFGPAYDTEVQRWVDAVRRGSGVDEIAATAYDGYAAGAVCAAAVTSLRTGLRVPVALAAP
jgi:myo-inositol 2-dehydrogenase/D-chiro-inositol 1-dehydrogenase